MGALNNTVPVSGAKGQEGAAPAAGTEEINITGSDIDDEDMDIDDEEEDIDDGNDDDDDESDGDDEEESETGSAGKGTKEPDRNAVFADIRRKAEAEARIKAAQEAQRLAAAEVDKAFADMGLRDPYTGKAITTKKEYDAYKERHASETISKELGKAGISREAIDALIESHPAVKQAKEAADSFASAQRQTQETAAKARLDSQIKEITALDPAIKTADDLASQPNYEQLRDYVRKGLSIVESYKLANIDKLSGRKAAAAAQSAYNRTQSKEHLTSSAARGQGEAAVPKAVMDNYRRLCPNMTAKEIRADYAKHLKKYM